MPRTLTITSDNIPLPKALAKKWRGAQVEFDDAGMMFIHTIRPRPLKELLPILKEAGKKITKRDLAEAIRWARAQA